jgi:hypothetical protein
LIRAGRGQSTKGRDLLTPLKATFPALLGGAFEAAQLYDVVVCEEDDEVDVRELVRLEVCLVVVVRVDFFEVVVFELFFLVEVDFVDVYFFVDVSFFVDVLFVFDLDFVVDEKLDDCGEEFGRHCE